jgi:hypothetical protein
MLLAKFKLINMRMFASYSKHAKVINQYLIIIKSWLQSSLHHPYNSHNKHNEVELQHNDCNKQESLMSQFESFFQHCKDNQPTTRHSRVMKTSRVATVHDVIKEMIRAHLTLVHVFHVISRWTSVGGPCTILVYILEVWWDSFCLSDPRSY